MYSCYGLSVLACLEAALYKFYILVQLRECVQIEKSVTFCFSDLHCYFLETVNTDHLNLNWKRNELWNFLCE